MPFIKTRSTLFMELLIYTVFLPITLPYLFILMSYGFSVPDMDEAGLQPTDYVSFGLYLVMFWLVSYYSFSGSKCHGRADATKKHFLILIVISHFLVFLFFIFGGILTLENSVAKYYFIASCIYSFWGMLTYRIKSMYAKLLLLLLIYCLSQCVIPFGKIV